MVIFIRELFLAEFTMMDESAASSCERRQTDLRAARALEVRQHIKMV